MKRLLQLSLALNVVLLVSAIWRTAPKTPILRTPRSFVGEPAESAWKRRSHATGVAFAPRSAWQSIEARDLSRWIANLRAIGCPEATIRDLVTFRVCHASRQQMLALQEEDARAWDFTANQKPGDVQRRLSRERAIRNEMIATLETALGERWSSIRNEMLGWEGPSDDGEGGLSPDQRRQLRDIESRYSQLNADWQEKGSQGIFGLDDLEKARAQDAAKRAELAVVLSPAELQDYLSRSSPAADYVRQNLPPAKSEAEFRTMVDLADRFGMRNDLPSVQGQSPLISNDDPVAQAINAQKADFNQALQTALGDDRIAEQKAEEAARAEQQRREQAARDEESARSQIADVAASVGIAPADALRFFDRVKELEPNYKTKYDDLQNNSTGTPEEKQQLLEAAVKADFEKLAVEMMGEKGRTLLERMIREH